MLSATNQLHNFRFPAMTHLCGCGKYTFIVYVYFSYTVHSGTLGITYTVYTFYTFAYLPLEGGGVASHGGVHAHGHIVQITIEERCISVKRLARVLVA